METVESLYKVEKGKSRYGRYTTVRTYKTLAGALMGYGKIVPYNGQKKRLVDPYGKVVQRQITSSYSQ